MQAFGTQLLGSGEQQRRAGLRWWVWFCLVVALTALIGLIMLRGGPEPAVIGWILYAPA